MSREFFFTRSRRDEDANVSARPMTAGASDGDRLLRVPESPPPPYVTPPGTVRKNVMAGLSASMRQICPVRRSWLRRSAQYPQATSSDEASRGPSSSVLVDVAHVLPDAGTFSTENSPSPKEEAPIVRDAVQAGVAETPEKNYDENLARTSSTCVIPLSLLIFGLDDVAAVSRTFAREDPSQSRVDNYVIARI